VGRVAKEQQQSRARAGARRIALEQGRGARDQWVQAATAEAVVAMGECDEALGQIQAAVELASIPQGHEQAGPSLALVHLVRAVHEVQGPSSS